MRYGAGSPMAVEQWPVTYFAEAVTLMNIEADEHRRAVARAKAEANKKRG